MFVPAQHRVLDTAAVHELVRSYPLAVLVSNGPDAPIASHVPVITRPAPVDRSAEPGSALPTLVGHMNRANPHWTMVRAGCRALMIFTGPHGYVSPTVYDYTPAAPTWNFTAVHVTGTVSALPKGAETLAVITDTVAAFESRFGQRWDMGSSLGYFDRILPGVGAFRMDVDSVQAMFKLSQEQAAPVRGRVTDAFAESPVGLHRQLAAMMAELAPAVDDR